MRAVQIYRPFPQHLERLVRGLENKDMVVGVQIEKGTQTAEHTPIVVNDHNRRLSLKILSVVELIAHELLYVFTSFDLQVN